MSVSLKPRFVSNTPCIGHSPKRKGMFYVVNLLLTNDNPDQEYWAWRNGPPCNLNNTTAAALNATKGARKYNFETLENSTDPLKHVFQPSMGICV